MSIEDLLAESDSEDRRPAPVRKGRVRWFTAVLAAAGGTALTYFLLRVEELTASLPVLFAGFLAVALLHRVVMSVGVPARPRRSGRPMPGGEEPSQYNWANGDGLRRAVGRWERVLTWSTEDAARFYRLTVPAVRELADERLRQRHNITIASDQQRARELLGEALWTLLTAPPKRAPKPRQFASLVTRLEEL